MPGHITRRRFVRRVAAGSCLVTGLNTTLETAFTAQTSGSPATYDLLIAGGRAIDPSQNLSDPRDIAISKAAAERAGWEKRPSPHQGQTGSKVTGRGIGYSQRNGV